MKILITILFFLFSFSASSGSLYSFDNASVKATAINWLIKTYPKLINYDLKHKYTLTRINGKNQKLIATVFLSYRANNKHGILYTCAKIDEYGTLISSDINIEAYKRAKLFVDPIPEKIGCNEQP